MDIVKILNALRDALETNSYILCGTKITVFPTEFVIALCNYLSNDEKGTQ